MLTLERQEEILRILKEKKAASVEELSKRLFIGPATIRRDLDVLQRQRLVKRTHGGVVLLEGLNTEIPLYVRESERAAEKDAIGRTAASLVRDGDILILDSSSTTFHMIPFLRARENLTCITNGAKTALALGGLPHARVYCTGGRLRENSLSFVGGQAKHAIADYHAQRLFFSCRGVTREHGAMDASDEEAELRRAMIAIAGQVVLLCDASKLGRTAFSRVCPLDDIDVLVTDRAPDAEWARVLAEHGVEVVV